MTVDWRFAEPTSLDDLLQTVAAARGGLALVEAGRATAVALNPGPATGSLTVVDIRGVRQPGGRRMQPSRVIEAVAGTAAQLTSFWSLGLPWTTDMLATLARSSPDLDHLVVRRAGIGEAGAEVIARHLTKLATLNLSGNAIGEAGARAVAQRLTNLSTLHLGGNGIGKAGAEAVAQHLTNLTTLNLWGNGIGEAGARAVAQRLTNLSTLHLGGNGIGSAGAEAIAYHLENLTTLHLWRNRIGNAGAEAIARHLTNLTALHLWGNRIGEAGSQAIARQLTSLAALNLSGNDIGDAVAEAIAIHLTSLTNLDVSGNRIGRQGAAAIAQGLTSLITLNMSDNEIGEAGAETIGPQLAGLARLTNLNLSGNRVGDTGLASIAQCLAMLAGFNTLNLARNEIGAEGACAAGRDLATLTALNLGDNRIGDSGAEAIAPHVVNLSTLDLSRNQLGDTGARAIASHLRNLTTLSLSRNQIGNSGAQAIADGLRSLTTLNLAHNDIGEEGASAIASRLSCLTSLNLAENRIGDGGAEAIATHLANLSRLDLWGSRIGDRGAGVIAEHLLDLTSLELSRNRIGDIGAKAIAEHLSGLATLNLSQNRIGDLRPFEDWLRQGVEIEMGRAATGFGLSLAENPLVTPPMDIARQGSMAVLNYFSEQRAQGTDRLFEAKVLLVGEGRAGKTSLLRRLYRPEMPLPPEEDTTKGIDIHRQQFALGDGRTFRLNLWDFGGQEIYHATHQFFLTRRSLYILLDDTAKSDRTVNDEAFKYWLDAIEVLTDASPVLIFQNEKGGRSKQIGIGGIKGRFPNVLEVFAGDLSDHHSADRLRQEIEHRVQLLDHVGDELPAKWVAIRADIEQRATLEPVITEEEYFGIYADHLEFDATKARLLSRYLHDIGVCLHFQESELLRRLVILRNEWATLAVFALLDDERIKNRKGLFFARDCERVWGMPEYRDRHPELLELVERFELCFKVQAKPATWLAPQLLSPERPAKLDQWAKPGDPTVAFKYDFLPKGAISRLIVRLHRYVGDRDLAWADGVLFTRGETSVLAEIEGRGAEIRLRARGPERRDLLAVVADELDALNDSYGDLSSSGRVHKLVPCTCELCMSVVQPHLYDYRGLVRRREDGQATVQCDNSYVFMDVLHLIDGANEGRGPAGADQEFGYAEESVERYGAIEIRGDNATVNINAGRHAVSATSHIQRDDSGSLRSGLPDRIQIWTAAGAVVGSSIAALIGWIRHWDFHHTAALLTVGGLGGLGTVAGAAGALVAEALRDRWPSSDRAG